MQKAVAAGPDWLVIDAEVEYESTSGAAMATALFNALAASSIAGATFGYSSFGIPSYHTAFPWGVFSAHCQVAMPQVYWGEFGLAPAAALSKSLSDCASYGLPVAPAGQCYGSVTADEILAFGATAVDAGLPGISFWSWQHASDALFEAIKKLEGGNLVSVPAWKTEAMRWLLAKGLVSQQHDPTESWDAATIAAVLRNLDEGSTLDDWAKESWEKAVAKGIVVDGTMPRGLVTQEMLAVILDKLKLL